MNSPGPQRSGSPSWLSLLMKWVCGPPNSSSNGPVSLSNWSSNQPCSHAPHAAKRRMTGSVGEGRQHQLGDPGRKGYQDARARGRLEGADAFDPVGEHDNGQRGGEVESPFEGPGSAADNGYRQLVGPG